MCLLDSLAGFWPDLRWILIAACGFLCTERNINIQFNSIKWRLFVVFCFCYCLMPLNTTVLISTDSIKYKCTRNPLLISVFRFCIRFILLVWRFYILCKCSRLNICKLTTRALTSEFRFTILWWLNLWHLPLNINDEVFYFALFKIEFVEFMQTNHLRCNRIGERLRWCIVQCTLHLPTEFTLSHAVI